MQYFADEVAFEVFGFSKSESLALGEFSDLPSVELISIEGTVLTFLGPRDASKVSSFVSRDTLVVVLATLLPLSLEDRTELAFHVNAWLS